MSKRVAFIGGDLRQEYMVRILRSQGVEVVTYGLGGHLHEIPIIKAKDLYEALRDVEVVIAPIPLTKDGTCIHLTAPIENLLLSSLLEFLHHSHTLYAGCIPDEFLRVCKEKKVGVVDFMKVEEITVFNTIATAEGAICEAILSHPSNIHNSECVVLGFGRCAKTLADKLRGMSVRVSVCARSGKARAEANAHGFETCTFGALKERLHRYDLIFNTVPAMVLGEDELGRIGKDAVIIDIASSPGGVDFEAAKRLGRKAELCLGLPGKYSPKASAEELLKWIDI